MAQGNVARLMPLSKRDAKLSAHCRTFVARELEYMQNYMAHANHDPGTWSAAEEEARRVELDQLADRVCRSRARSLTGIRARLRTLRHLAPDWFEAGEADCTSTRLLAALLRDLRTVLKVDDV